MLTKLATFRGVSPSGEPLTRLFRPGDSIVKVAGTMMPRIQKWLSAYQPDSNKLAVLVNAMGSSEYWGQNVNGDIFPENALVHDCRNHPSDQHPYDDFTGKIIPPYGYWTFLQAFPFVHHRNKDPNRAFGKVVLACWNPKMHRVELIILLDKQLALQHGAQHVIDRILAGEFPDVSMGCKVPYDVCFPAGTLVTTEVGYRAIESIQEGSMVLSHEGRPKKVVGTSTRLYRGPMVQLGVWGCPRSLTQTANHPLEVVREEKLRGCHGSAGGIRRRHSPDETGICKTCHRVIDLGREWVAAEDIRVGDYLVHPVQRSFSTPPEDRIVLSSEMARLFGLYLGDGHIIRQRSGKGKTGEHRSVGVGITFGDDHPEVLDRFLSDCQTLHERGELKNLPCLYEQEGKHAQTANIYGTELTETFERLGGCGCKEKFLHPDVFSWSLGTQLSVLGGLIDSDGCQDKNGAIRVASINEKMILGAQRLCFAAGILGAVSSYTSKGSAFSGPQEVFQLSIPGSASIKLSDFSAKVRPVHRSQGSAAFLVGYNAFLPVQSTDHYEDDLQVYNLQVDEDESYVAGGVSVHNCTICGHKSKTRQDYCNCIRYIGMGKILDDGRRIGVVNLHPRFFDISFVFIGADKTAKVMMKLGAENSRGDLWLPQSLRDADQIYKTACGAKDCRDCVGGCKVKAASSSLSMEQVIEFLKKHPNPEDEELHAWAESRGFNVHEVEDLMYRLATAHIKESAAMDEEEATKALMKLVKPKAHATGPLDMPNNLSFVVDKELKNLAKRAPEPRLYFGREDDQEREGKRSVEDGDLRTNANTNETDEFRQPLTPSRGKTASDQMSERVYRVKGYPDLIDRLDRVLETTKALGQQGASREILFSVDGDGPEGLKVLEGTKSHIDGKKLYDEINHDVIHVGRLKPEQTKTSSLGRDVTKGTLAGSIGGGLGVGTMELLKSRGRITPGFLKAVARGMGEWGIAGGGTTGALSLMSKKGSSLTEVFDKAKDIKIGPPPSPNRKGFPFVGTISFKGIQIGVENAPGTWRTGKGWKTLMKLPYGEFLANAMGADKDKLDVYVGPYTDAPNVYVVHQNRVRGPEAGHYDEDKVMLGFRSPEEAKASYLAHYDDDRFFRSITTMSFPLFKRALLGEEFEGDKVATVKQLLEKTAADFRLEDLFDGHKLARRRQRTWRDEVSGQEVNVTGSGINKTASKKKVASPTPHEILKMSAEKWADIVKEVGPDKAVGKVSPLLSASEPSLPSDLLNGLGEGDLTRGLSTTSSMGMVLKPEEFQRILLAALGEKGMADELEGQNAVFSPEKGELAPCPPLESELLDRGLLQKLLPHLGEKSYFGPVVRRRIIRIIVSKPPESTPQKEVTSPLLSKVSSAYTWYRREQMKLAGDALRVVPSIPALHSGLYGLDDVGLFSKTADGWMTPKTMAVILGAIPLTLMYSAHLRRREGRGEDLGLIRQLIADHPWLATLGTSAALREVMKTPQARTAVDELLAAGQRIWKGQSRPNL